MIEEGKDKLEWTRQVSDDDDDGDGDGDDNDSCVFTKDGNLDDASSQGS